MGIILMIIAIYGLMAGELNNDIDRLDSVLYDMLYYGEDQDIIDEYKRLIEVKKQKVRTKRCQIYEYLK